MERRDEKGGKWIGGGRRRQNMLAEDRTQCTCKTHHFAGWYGCLIDKSIREK